MLAEIVNHVWQSTLLAAGIAAVIALLRGERVGALGCGAVAGRRDN